MFVAKAKVGLEASMPWLWVRVMLDMVTMRYMWLNFAMMRLDNFRLRRLGRFLLEGN